MTTFAQAIDLTEQGSRKEALLGCDFVLRLDPLFEPARTLHRRLRDTDAAVDTTDLRSLLNELGISDAAPEEPAGEELPPPAPSESPAVEATDSIAEPDSSFDDLSADGPDLTDAGTPVTSAQEPVETEPELSADEELSFVDRIEAELDAHFGPAAGDAAAETQDEDRLSPDTNLSEPSLSGPAFDDPLPQTPPETLGGSALGPGGLPLEGDGTEFDTDSDSLGAPRALDPESERRIAELLDEGQGSFDLGEYQAAIDSWSRVFLIDIDHQEANRRIEEARRMAAEKERQVEEVFHEAMSHLDESDLEAAREALNRVLEMQPTHLAALEYLERIDSGDVGTAELPDLAEFQPEGDFAVDAPLDDVPEPEDFFPDADLPPLPKAPAEPSTAPVEPVAVSKARRDPRRLFISVGSAVLVLVLIGGWFLYDNWSLFFPNSQSAQDVVAPPRIDPIRRAQALHEEGKTAIAIAQLRRLPPGDPHYAEAQALVAQWETTEAEPEAEGPSPENLERYRAMISAARTAHNRGENLRAAALFERAAHLAELDERDLAMQAATEANLAPLRDQIEVFRSGDWEYALPALWRMREADSDNADVTSLIIDCYYNLGVRDLQRGRPDSAMRKFEEALTLAPDDRTLNRLRAFSETYSSRPEDLLYRIFVKYLPFR